MSVFFLGSLGLNRSEGQTNRVSHEAVLGRFVWSVIQLIQPWIQQKRYSFLISTMLPTKTLPRIIRKNVFISSKFRLPCKVGNETETKHNKAKLNKTKRNKTKRDEANRNANRNETQQIVIKMKQMKNEFYFQSEVLICSSPNIKQYCSDKYPNVQYS